MRKFALPERWTSVMAQIFCMPTAVIIWTVFALRIADGIDPVKSTSFIFTSEPSDAIAVHDGSLTLNCATSGRPEATIQWKRDGIPINLNGDSRRSMLANGSLLFSRTIHSRTDKPDEGVYQCTATSQMGTIVSRPVKLQIATLPPFEDEPQDQRRIEGHTARMACFVAGAVPPPRISWYKDERPLIRDVRMFVLASGALEIGAVRPTDAGSYKCKVENLDGEKFSATGRLMVDGNPDPDIEPQSPVFDTRTRTMTVRRGESATLECSARGFPVPTITWLKNGHVIDFKASRFYTVGHGNLKIDNLQPDDAGQYKCRAENSADTVDQVISLEITEAPVLVKKPIDTVGRKDSDVLLECEIRGNPEPITQWLKNGDIVIPSDYFQIDNSKNLRILGLVNSDAGIYQCLGTNSVGSVQGTAQLLVLDADAKVPTFYKIHAPTVGAGAAPPTNVPSAPRDLIANLISSRFVTLSWRAPAVANSGAALTYSVYYKQLESTRERVFNTSSMPPQKEIMQVNIQALRRDSTYSFRVVAYNDRGPGESTKELNVRTHPEVDVPGPVSNFRVFPLSTTEIKVEWEPPQYGTGLVQRYRISYHEAGKTPPQEVETEKRQFVLTGLRPFVSYVVKVVAFNENGVGTSTTEVPVRTYSDVPTGQPENVFVEPTSANSITVRWEPPATNTQNGLITGYKIRYRNKNIRKSEVITVDGVRRAYTVTNLERGQTYLVRVAATNVNGTGPPTDWLPGETFSDDLDELKEPGEPSALRLRSTAKTILVTWSPPSNANVVVRGYTIGWGIGLPDVYSKIVDSKERTFTIDELESGVEYVISLRAFNNMGDGKPTYESIFTRLPHAPTEHQDVLLPPVGLQAVVLSNTTVLLRWTDSSLPQGQLPVDNRVYTARYSRLNGETARPAVQTIESADLEVLIKGLLANTPYLFEVKVSKSGHQSAWSLSVQNRTYECEPASHPLDLTVLPLQNNPTVVMVNYSPPDQPNGLITGYVVFYTSDNSMPEQDWDVEPVVGDKLTTLVRKLMPNTKYYFKIQARNSKGYSPLSPAVVYTTPIGDPSRSYTEEPEGLSSNTLYIIIACVVCFSLIVITVIVVCYCCRRKCCKLGGTSHKGNNGYNAPKTMKHGFGKADLKPSDLWIHHNDNHELKNADEKSPHEIIPILKHSNEYTNNMNLATLERLQKRTNSFADIKNNIDGRTYNDMNKFNSLSRRPQRPVLITLDHSSREAVGNSVPVVNNNGGINNRPPDSMQRNVFPRQPPLQGQRLPTIESSPQHSQGSPDPSTPSTTAGYDTASSGAQILSGTDTMRSASHRSPHPLKSFCVPAPPAPATPGLGITPRQSALRPMSSLPNGPNHPTAHTLSSQTPNGSPYKRAPMTVSIHGQPHQTRSPKPPVTFASTLPTKEDGRPSYAYSSEELSVEMANLDGLMKDLTTLTEADFKVPKLNMI